MIPRRVDPTREDFHPVYVVWELTLACDQPCTHCGSRAGTARPGELSTEEALGVVAQLAAQRAREVVLIGGEAYLHPGFLDVVRALKAAGIRPMLTTGGRGVTAELAGEMARAGLHGASVSVDGLEETHDLMRAARGSFASATAALGHLKAAGVRIAANTNLNRLNQGDLEGLYEHLKAQGIGAWQVQITAPLGRAADRPDLLLQPWDLVELMPRLARLKERAYAERITLMPGNNLGYFGPEEGLLRSLKEGAREHWRGCQAGRYVLGIESSGAVKGCPSLQTAHYVGGNLREQSLERIWNESPQLAFTRTRTVEDLWGFCRTCPFAEVCMGGCSFTAHALFGKPGNNPYCHYRAKTLAAQGKRERLLPKAPAPGQPFDNGLYEIVEEPIDAHDPKPELKREYVKTRRWPKRPDAG
ncbi:SPASM domain-containing protein [Myxococcaceae bacterium GXIMD 01537]